MKRKDNLFEQITDFNNLRTAYLKALKGKRFSNAALIFDLKTDENLYRIKNSLEKNTYKIGNYRQFKIYDPKERIITAASFEDRIVHHSIMNILEPVFERQFVFHTYACRKQKGTHKAVQYVFKKSKSCKYFLKLDVKKYFDSISHRKLKDLLLRIIKDKQCLSLLFSIIDSYNVSDCCGLPIGNLTSQFFANYYLSPLDHFVLEKLNPKGYVRYMDDIIVFSDSKGELKNIYKEMQNFIAPFSLNFKQPVINSCKNGVPFLGFSVSDSGILLLNKNRKRKIKKINRLVYDFNQGLITEGNFVDRLNSICSVNKILKGRKLFLFSYKNSVFPLVNSRGGEVMVKT